MLISLNYVRPRDGLLHYLQTDELGLHLKGTSSCQSLICVTVTVHDYHRLLKLLAGDGKNLESQMKQSI